MGEDQGLGDFISKPIVCLVGDPGALFYGENGFFMGEYFSIILPQATPYTFNAHSVSLIEAVDFLPSISGVKFSSSISGFAA